MTGYMRHLAWTLALSFAALMTPDDGKAAVFDVTCNGNSCLGSGWEMYGETVLTPGGDLIEVFTPNGRDFTVNGGNLFRRSGLNTNLICLVGNCIEVGWTESDPSPTGAGALETATCLSAGCFTDGILFTRSSARTLTPWNINWLGASFDVASAELTCRGSDCAANGWDIFSGGSLIAEADCQGAGCFTTGYRITTHAIAAVPLPAALPLLGGALLAFGAVRTRRRRPA